MPFFSYSCSFIREVSLSDNVIFFRAKQRKMELNKMKAACQVTHDIILTGRCPWCSSVIIDGVIRPSFPYDCSDKTSFIKWSISTLTASFSVKPKDYILSALSDLLLHDSRTEPFLPIFRLGLQHYDSQIRWMTVDILRNRGILLLSHEADLYEKKLNDNPEEVILHILLLYHYTSMIDSLSETNLLNRQNHILWMIETHPELITLIGPYALLHASVDSDVLYRQALEIWDKQLVSKVNNPGFLESMADFFSENDLTLSESLYKKALSIDPNNPKLRAKLAHLYVLRMHDIQGNPSRQDLARRALTEYEAAYSQQTEELERFWLLPDLAKQAYEAGEQEKARNYAQEMLRMAALPQKLMQNNGDATHYGHLILGRLALEQGDREKAKWHLLESGKSKGSPVLNSFGPNMMLAKELLDLGEREVVIHYLTLCSNFWLSLNHVPQQWIYTIEHGCTPDFGANL